jgi:hypothetical protein
MDLVDIDLCVVLPIAALETWVRADPAERVGWLSGHAAVAQVDVGGEPAFVFRRSAPRPIKPLVIAEPRRRVHVVIDGVEAAVQRAIEAPFTRRVLDLQLPVASSLLVIGGDLAHADVAGGTPVAGPHRVADLERGTYRVEHRSAGTAGAADFAQVISFERA